MNHKGNGKRIDNSQIVMIPGGSAAVMSPTVQENLLPRRLEIQG